MRIALIAHHVAPIAPPFVGGVESHTWYLARALARAGHDVTLFAMPGSSVPGVTVEPLGIHEAAVASLAARRDVSSMPEPFLVAHHAYLQLMLELAHRDEFDAIHINTLHYLPVAMAASLPVRPLLTLHCPPTPWLESALRVAARTGTMPVEVVAVSSALAAAWSHVMRRIPVIPNGIDLDTWHPGPGAPGGVRSAVWAGRIVPEKAPHLALDAARLAGFELHLAGPVIDQSYFDREVAPRLGAGARHVGHQTHRELIELVGSVSVAIQSPAWDEPFGLFAAEAIACGTPVAAFARGGLVDVVGPGAGVLARTAGVDALAVAVAEAASLDRGGVRARADRNLGLGSMRAAYEHSYEALAGAGRRRPGVGRLRERMPLLGRRGLTPGVHPIAPVPQLALEGPSS